MQKNEGSKTTLTWEVINTTTGKSTNIPCNVWGEISEKRVEELEKLKVDTAANIIELPNGNLYLFDEIGYRIQPYDKLKAELLNLAKQIVNDFDKQNN